MNPPPVARFAVLSADRIRTLVPTPPLHNTPAEAAELLLVLAAQAQRTPTDVEQADADVRRAPVAWVQRLMQNAGDDFDAAKYPSAMRLLLDVNDNARVAVGAANNSFDIRLRPWVHAQVQPPLKPEQTGRERYQNGLAAGLEPLVAARAAAPSSYPSARTLVARLWAHTLSALWPDKREIWFDAAQTSAQYRVVVGAHFPSDLTAAQMLADAAWEDIRASHTFQIELFAAQAEIAAQRKQDNAGAGRIEAPPTPKGTP